MSRKRPKPEEIVARLRQAGMLIGQGQSVADAIRTIGVSEVTYYRWCTRLYCEDVRYSSNLAGEGRFRRKPVLPYMGAPHKRLDRTAAPSEHRWGGSHA